MIKREESLVFVDFETYFSSKDNYTLSQKKGGLSMLEYVRDSRFKSHGFGLAVGTEKPKWYSPSHIPSFDWSNTVIVGHNLKFDGLILFDQYGIQPKEYRDTLVLSRAILGKTVKSHSLANLAEHFGLVAKGVMKTDGLRHLSLDQEKELADYCLHDVELCQEIYYRLWPSFPTSQRFFMDWSLRNFINPQLRLDTSLLEKTAKEEKERRIKIFEEIKIDKTVFSSNPKFQKLLEQEGFEVPMKESPRVPGKMIPCLALGDTEFLDMVNSENERLSLLCEARIAAKSTLLETRSEKLARIGKTGAWPFDVEMSGAEQTHRFSGGNGAGGNPQNFTKKSSLRRAVKAPMGSNLIVGDFDKIEARFVAYLSKDRGLINLIDGDLYSDFASAYFGRRITKSDVSERQFGKISILGLNYGMGWEKFQKTVRKETGKVISEKEAKNAIYLYRQKYPDVPRLWRFLDSFINELTTEKTGQIGRLPVSYEKETIVLPSGLKCRYMNLRKEGKEWVFDVWRRGRLEKTKLYGGKLLENICQSLTGDLCKEAAEPFGRSFVGQMHDEIILCERQESCRDSSRILHERMTTAPKWLPNMTLKAEVGIGSNWLEAKENTISFDEVEVQ